MTLHADLAPVTVSVTGQSGPVRWNRVAVVAVYVVLALSPGSLGQLTRSLMTDAYVQVSVFVAATLLLFYGAERLFRFNIGTALQARGAWQVPLASLLGATPGCGGAVVVVAAYSSGHVRFGAVVATLTATMGDAAFLLIATRPDAAAVVLPLSLAVGILSGWIIDALGAPGVEAPRPRLCEVAARIGRPRTKDYAYVLLALPGLIVGGAQLFQHDVTSLLGVPAPYLAMAGTAVGLLILAGSPLHAMTNANDAPVTRAP